MNYFTHAIRFLDRPVFVIGTSLPDMMSVADRRVRLRSKRVEPFTQNADPFVSELACGVRQHLDDDRWFHNTRAFAEVTAELTRLYREAVGPDDSLRCAFLGHIVMELQLDGVLVERYPERLDEYYQRLEEIDEQSVQDVVNQMATGTTQRLALLIQKFRTEQFLRDYNDPSALRKRLNQIMLRVGLEQLPEALEGALTHSAQIVRHRCEELLPRDKFQFP